MRERTKEGTVLVVFGEEMPRGWLKSCRRYEVIVATPQLQREVEGAGLLFVSIEPLVGAGSIYEARSLFEKLSYLKFADGTRITTSFLYKGYELWWIHADSLYSYFCLPYTQYKDLLAYLKNFQVVHFYRPPYGNLFARYLQAYGSEIQILRSGSFRSRAFLPFGVVLQIVITLLYLPILIAKKHHLMIYTGDKFEKGKDYDVRMKFIYEELRRKGLPFVEFIRSLESWKTVVQHALIRKRPVIYSEAVSFVGQSLSILSGGRSRAKRELAVRLATPQADPETRFRLLVASQYLPAIYDDIWAIRIMKWILRTIGVQAAFIPAATERNLHSVLGCKLNAIPTVGIMHATASRHYNMYDFMPGFDGEQTFSVDAYGLWSEWWRGYYLKDNKTYKPGQLHISGPMRPLQPARTSTAVVSVKGGSRKVLFISEQLGVPAEAIPYLLALLDAKNISLHLKFRSYRDGFEDWLREHRPDVWNRIDQGRVFRGGMDEAIAECEVAVGSHSTATLEFLLQLKPAILYATRKWGDYFELKSFNSKHSFIAETPQKLLKLIEESRDIPPATLKELQNRFFGDPYKNGSAWVVAEMEKFL